MQSNKQLKFSSGSKNKRKNLVKLIVSNINPRASSLVQNYHKKIQKYKYMFLFLLSNFMEIFRFRNIFNLDSYKKINIMRVYRL